MPENQKNYSSIIIPAKIIELYGLEKEEFSKKILGNEPNTIFTICGNPLDEEEIQHLQYIRSEKQINERNLYIIKLHNEGMSNFNIMKRIGRIIQKKDWLVISSEDEIEDIIYKNYKKNTYTMENEKENFFSFIKLLDDSFYKVCNLTKSNSKVLGLNKTLKACNIANRLLHTRGEITGWFKPTIKTEDLHERYKSVVNHFKINIDNDSEKDNDMKKFANQLREMARVAKV